MKVSQRFPFRYDNFKKRRKPHLPLEKKKMDEKSNGNNGNYINRNVIEYEY